MPFLGERTQCLGKEREPAHLQCWFAALGDKTCSFNADEIADIQQAKEIDKLRPNLICMNIDLNSPCGVAQVEKVAFAHVAMGGDTTRRTQRIALLKSIAHFHD